MGIIRAGAAAWAGAAAGAAAGVAAGAGVRASVRTGARGRARPAGSKPTEHRLRYYGYTYCHTCYTYYDYTCWYTGAGARQPRARARVEIAREMRC